MPQNEDFNAVGKKLAGRIQSEIRSRFQFASKIGVNCRVTREKDRTIVHMDVLAESRSKPRDEIVAYVREVMRRDCPKTVEWRVHGIAARKLKR